MKTHTVSELSYAGHLKSIVYLFCVLIFVLTASCSPTGEAADTSVVVRVYAAASTREVVEEVCRSATEAACCTFEANYASSGTLARQIANGAGGDIFVSANVEWIDFLIDNNLIDSTSVQRVASNKLVLAAQQGSSVAAPQFSRNFDILSVVPGRIAIGDPAYVPVGKYAKMVLDTLHWYEAVKSKTIMGKDAAAVLRYAEMGECDWAIVYRSDAIRSKNIRILATVPDSLYKPVAYYVATLKEHRLISEKVAAAFADSLGQAVFARYGFEPPTP